MADSVARRIERSIESLEELRAAFETAHKEIWQGDRLGALATLMGKWQIMAPVISDLQRALRDERGDCICSGCRNTVSVKQITFADGIRTKCELCPAPEEETDAP